jgi:hypothetical protein
VGADISIFNLITLVVAIFSIIMNFVFFIVKRKDDFKEKFTKLSENFIVLDTKFKYLEEPIKIIQTELLLRGLRSTYDPPEEVLRKIGASKK